MRYRTILVIGIIMILFGAVFQFQGRGELGPESSFMYQNKTWIDYGVIIIIAGIITSGASILFSRR